MLKILFIIGFIHQIQCDDLKQSNDSYSSLSDFKERLIDFINLNGGLESLGRAASSRYQEGYRDEERNPGFAFPQQNYGNGEQSSYAQLGYGQENNDGQQYGNGYDQGYYGQNYGYDQQNYAQGFYNQQGYGNPAYLNYLYNQGGYGQQQPGYYGQQQQQGYYGQQQGYFGEQNYGYPRPRPDRYPQRYPIRYRPSPAYRPPGEPGFLEALSSISRHDDLRCVPRLLCEVASAGKSVPSQDSYIPFTNKDSLVALLTVLNFVDNSPIMNFGRAALLGYAVRGDSRQCLQAYPTCPRDPDRLVEYLNNHNGGFFRFFQGAPGQNGPGYGGQNGYGQYGGYGQNNALYSSGYTGVFDRPQYDPQNYDYNKKYRPHKYPSQYSPGNQYRILSKPDIQSSLYPSSLSHFQSPQYQDDHFTLSPSKKTKKLSFPNDSPKYTIAKPLVTDYQDNFPNKDHLMVRPIKGQYFLRPTTQFFPDSSTSENHLPDYQQTFNKPYYYNKRGPKQIYFPESYNGFSEHGNRMVFPQFRVNNNTHINSDVS